MAKTTKIECDACGADLTYTGNCVDYRLVLGSEAKPTYPDACVVTAMGIYPPVKRTFYFCDLACLDHWRGRENYISARWNEWNEKWKREHGNEWAPGQWSYPVPPEEVRKERDEAFATDAMMAFPMQRPKRHV